MDALSIGEVARQSEVHISTIRYYESIGLLATPKRIGGWRSYEPEILVQLRAIRTARELGFTLDEIRMLLDGFPKDTPPSERWRAYARKKLVEVEGYVARANRMKALLETTLRCECVRMEECFGENDDFCAPSSPTQASAEGDTCSASIVEAPVVS
jgi:MerR family redox-sensitive transcriptional activator SoxR